MCVGSKLLNNRIITSTTTKSLCRSAFVVQDGGGRRCIGILALLSSISL